MKKFTTICAVALAAVCTVSFTACSSSSGSSSSFSSKWYVRTGYLGIQPSSVYDDGYDKEVLVYDINFANDGGNSIYSVSYNQGHTLTTEFYATEYDWSSGTIESYQVSGETEYVYVYKTSFTISGAYTYASTGETVEFEDEMTSLCYFRSARNNLQPIYSYQKVLSASPANFSPTGKNDMCETVSYEYHTYYNKDCTEATTYYDNLLDDDGFAYKTCDLTGTGNTLLDNNSLYTAIRALNITSSLSMNFDIYIPAEKTYSAYNVAGADGVTLEDETILNALEGAGYVADGDAVTYSAATLSYTGSLTGTSQTIWYATLADDVDNNVCRSTMLKIELPLSFGLGTLEFTLSEVTSHFDV